MIISEPKKAIIVEIPGTKCEKISELFAPHVMEKHQLVQSIKTNERFSGFSRSLSSFTQLEIDPKDYYKIVAVRNPYSRLIDIWENYYKFPEKSIDRTFANNLRFSFARHTGLNPFPAQEFHHMFPEGDFKSFIVFLDYILTKFSLNIARKYIGAADQYSYIENDDWIEFDLIASFETLQLDIADIAKQFNLEITETFDLIEERNRQEQNNLISYYDEEMLKIVNRLFIRDFVYFQYSKLSLFDLNQAKKITVF